MLLCKEGSYTCTNQPIVFISSTVCKGVLCVVCVCVVYVCVVCVCVVRVCVVCVCVVCVCVVLCVLCVSVLCVSVLCVSVLCVSVLCVSVLYVSVVCVCVVCVSVFVCVMWDILVESFHLAYIHVQVEAGSGLSHDRSHSRSAGILVFDWDHGKPAALDSTVVSPLNANILNKVGMTARAAAQAAEARKHMANDQKCTELGGSYYYYY